MWLSIRFRRRSGRQGLVRQQGKLWAFIRVAQNIFREKGKGWSSGSKPISNPNDEEVSNERGSSGELCQTLSWILVGFFWPVIYKAALITGCLKVIVKPYILAGPWPSLSWESLQTCIRCQGIKDKHPSQSRTTTPCQTSSWGTVTNVLLSGWISILVDTRKKPKPNINR